MAQAMASKWMMAAVIGASGLLLAAVVHGAATNPPASGRLPGLADVLASGADPTGQRDSTPAFRAVLEAKDIHKVVVPCGTFRLAGTVTLPYAKTLEGFGACTQLRPDAGVTALKLTGGTGGSGITSLRDLVVLQLNKHPANIGVLIEFGNAGFTDWVLERVSILGSGAKGPAEQSGIGISARFALRGVIRDSIIEYWSTGIRFADAPNDTHSFANANLVTGSKIRINDVGVDLVVDTAYFVGNTIEGNRVGLRANTQNGLIVAVLGNHFENTATAAGSDLELLAGRLTSLGNTFAGQFPGNAPTFILRGGRGVSLGDVMARGMSVPPGGGLKQLNN